MITPPSLPDGLLTFRHRCYLLTSGNDIESATAFVMLSILTTPSAMIRRPRVKTIPKAMLSILSPCWRLYTPRITGSIQGSARSFLAPSSCFLIVTAWPNSGIAASIPDLYIRLDLLLLCSVRLHRRRRFMLVSHITFINVVYYICHFIISDMILNCQSCELTELSHVPSQSDVNLSTCPRRISPLVATSMS